MKEITLKINGREMVFSTDELTTIVESYFDNQNNGNFQEATKPTEGKVFRVDPQNINQQIFEEKREDPKQEKTRITIINAFGEVLCNPQKYIRPFKTMIPIKAWEVLTVAELIEKAYNYGGHCADWVEQALEWAQRISNGEPWEEVCNKPDNAKWHRLVLSEEGNARVVGGSIEVNDKSPASNIDYSNFINEFPLFDVVPLVVIYN